MALINNRGTIAAATVKAQNAVFFATALSPSGAVSSPTIFRVTVSFTTSKTIQITLDNASTWLSLNSAVALAANSLYTFDIMVKSGDLVNFQIPDTGGSTLNIFRVDEIIGGS